MPGAITQRINGRLAQSKSKGKAFLAELWNSMKPEAIAKEQDCPASKGKKK